MANSLLFSPISVGTMTLKNRIVYPPMATRYDIATERARAYYAERAHGGCGLVIVESTRVDNFADPQFVATLPALAEAIHRGGARACVQLSQAPTLPSGEAIAPSATDQAREVTVAEIRNIQEKFALAATRLKEAGFDAAEIHGAHGFFFSQFFSPRANRRADAYGGSLQNRMRFARETVRLIRMVVGGEFPLLYRMSGDEFHPEGPTNAESQALAATLEEAGVDAIDVSAGIAGQTPSVTSPVKSAPEGTYAYLAAQIKRAVRVPVIAVGRICRSEVAEHILANDQADLVALGRQLLADPYWPTKVAEGRESEVILCRYDNALCLGNLAKGMPIGCSVNPRAGKECEVPLPRL